MSQRKSESVLDMPATPLLAPAQGKENPFTDEAYADTSRAENDGDVQEDPPSPSLAAPRNFDNNLDMAVRRKKKFACAGILLLGLVIVGALIIVAVKQSQQHASEDQKPESYEEKLVRLYKLVNECQNLAEKEDCQPFLSTATAGNVDSLLQSLGSLIQDVKLNQTVENIFKFQSALENLDISEDVNSTNYKTIMGILKPLIMDMELDPRLQTDGDRESFVTSLGSNSNYTPSAEVHCDWREMRCRDKKKCYLISQHCDMKVDCEDNSDEDSCECVERLVGDRLCDGYLDCEGGEDEADCGCLPGTSFFCNDVDPVCVAETQVCDGAMDCHNGHDEADCYILAPSLNTVSPHTASEHGYLSVWRAEQQSYLPLAVLSSSPSMDLWVEQSCRGVRGSQPIFSQVSPPGGLTAQLAVMNSPGNLSVVRADSDSLPGDLSLLSVYCGNKVCGKSPAREESEDQLDCDDPSLAFDPRCAQARIVGGEVSLPEDWPATVAIFRDGVFICGGTVISPEWVITAAHCVFGYQSAHFYNVRVGMVRRQSQSPWEQQRHAEQVFLHPSYDNLYLKHDVALVKLNRPLNINARVQEVCLPYDTSMSPDPGSTCVAAGWGHTSEDGSSSEQLRHVEVPVLATCGYNYNNIIYQICGGVTEGGKDACQGDSGGPLYCKDSRDHWYLGGVISHGKGCARADEKGVYVRLSYYLAWLHDVMSGQLSPGTPGLECPGLQCDSGECVPHSWVCDLTVDCLDGGDVKGCVTLRNGTRVQLGLEEEEEITDIVTTGATPGLAALEFDYHEVTCSEEQFQCSSLEQCVPLVARCDGLRDCPDWSDETGCICADFLSPNTMCDGLTDCRDASDEENCGLCGDNQYRCHLSSQCIQSDQVCDTVPNCELEEDERYCTALSSSNYLSVDTSGDPAPEHHGLLLYRDLGTWKPICVTSFPSSLASRICPYMGYTADTFSLVSSESLDMDSSPEASSEESCQYVNVSCQTERCGQRPLYRNLPPSKSPAGTEPGTWPWQATFLVEGEIKCGGAVVDTTFVMTELDCAELLVAEGSRRFITVLVGQDRRTNVGLSPHSQVRRVVSLKVTANSRAVLAQLDTPLELTEHVNTLCLSSYSSTFSSCSLSGFSASSYTQTIPTIPRKCDDKLCLSTEAEEEESSVNWTGVVACVTSTSNNPIVYHGVAVFSNSSSATPFTDLTDLNSLIRTAAPASPLTDDCSGFRCRLGNCISSGKVCDRQWDCQEGEEEQLCPDISATSLPLCARQPEDPDHCLCPGGSRRCDNNLCLGLSYWCNAVSECGDTSDEPAQCATCLGKLELRQPEKLCDGTADCPDYEDELPESCGCPEGSWRCEQPTGLPLGNISSEDRGKCIEMSEVCDGHEDCPSGADEAHSQCIALSNKEDIQQDLFMSPVILSQGFLKVRTYGIWYTYCADLWANNHSAAICSMLGYQDLDNIEWSEQHSEQASLISAHSSDSSDSVNCSTVYIQCSTV